MFYNGGIYSVFSSNFCLEKVLRSRSPGNMLVPLSLSLRSNQLACNQTETLPFTCNGFVDYCVISLSKSKCVWLGNVTITDHRTTHGTVRTIHRIKIIHYN